MTRTIITSWSEANQAIDTLLPLAQKTILIFDSDLTNMQLNTQARAEQLRNFLRESRANMLKIALQDAEPFKKMPLLIKILADYSQRFRVLKTPPELAKLNDSMMLVDEAHAFIRFHKTQARSKLLIDEVSECADYLQRFDNIWKEGGTPIGADTLGL